MKRLLLIIVLSVFLGVCLVNAASVEVKFDFEEFEHEDDAKYIEEIIEEWEVFTAKAATNFVKVEDEGNNKLLHLNGYVEIRSWDQIEGPYTFSVDAKTEDTINVAFFVRGVLPVTRFNPKNGGGVDQVFHYLESDWYGENGGKNGASGLGGSGIYLMPMGEAKIRINIKNYQTDGLKMGTSYVDLAWPDGINPKEFFNISFKDDGEKVEIFLNQKLFLTVTMSNPGVYEDDNDDNNEYFKKAVVTDASGAEIMNIDNARISAKGSQVAISTRNRQVRIDNLSLTTEREATPAPTQTPNPTATPDKSDEVKNTATADPKPTSTKASDKTQEKEGINPVIIFSVIGAVVIIGTGIVLFLKLKKK